MGGGGGTFTASLPLRFLFFFLFPPPLLVSADEDDDPNPPAKDNAVVALGKVSAKVAVVSVIDAGRVGSDSFLVT